MTRNGTWLLAALAWLAGVADADDALLQQWDAPKRETFATKKMPGREAALEVRRRYGYDFECPATDAEVALRVKEATYFEALDRLAAGLGLYLVGVPVPEEKRGFLEGGLALQKAEEPMGPVVAFYLGPSRLSVESVALLAVRRCAPPAKPSGGPLGDLPVRILRDIQRFTPGAAEQPRMSLELKWIVEPGFDDVTMATLSIVQALDDKGQALRPRGDARMPVAANSVFDLDFEPPTAKAKSIRKIQGSARFSIPVERGEISFLASETGAAKTLGRASITIDKVDGTTVALTLVGTPAGIAREGTVPIDMPAGGLRHGEPAALTVIVYDEKGAEVPGRPRHSSSEEGKCTYELELERAAARIVFRAVTKVVAREAPFLLGNIPLPE